MSSNYPPGTGPNDPKAPWNQKDIELIECDECGGSGIGESATEEYDEIKCRICNGTGTIEVEDEE